MKKFYFIMDIEQLLRFSKKRLKKDEELYIFEDIETAKKNLIIYNKFFDFGFLIETEQINKRLKKELNISDVDILIENIELSGKIMILSNKEKTFFETNLNKEDNLLTEIRKLKQIVKL